MRTYTVCGDIFELRLQALQPAYDLIIGADTMKKWGVILNFDVGSVTIDKQEIHLRTHESLEEVNDQYSQFQAFVEPSSTRQATRRVTENLDAKYEKEDLHKVVQENCRHLSVAQRNKMLRLLLEFEELFDDTLGDWDTDSVNFELKEGAQPFHGRPIPIPKVHVKTLRNEVDRLAEIGVLVKQSSSRWAAPIFIIPKKDFTVCFISDFREVNKRIVRKQYPIPKVSTML